MALARESLRVLVVDDHPPMRSMLKKMLLQMDCFQVIEDAGDGEYAWEKLQSGVFDLVIADVAMPRLDGIGLLKRCRLDFQLRELPFLMVSGQSQPEWVAIAGEWGAYDYIIKPFSYLLLKKHIESLFEKYKSAEEVVYREVLRLKEQRRLKEALARIFEVQTREHSKIKWLNLQGECLMGLGGRREEAIACFERVITLSDGYLAAHKNLAAVQQELGNIDKAIEALEKADNLSPMETDRKITLGTLMLQAGRSDEGARFLDKAWRQAPAEQKELYRLRVAEIYLGHNLNEKAEELYVKTVKSNPAAVEAFNRLGIALRRQGKFKEAEKYYLMALKNHPNNAAICYNLGVLYFNRQENSEALKMFQRALQIDPAFKKAQERLKAVTNELASSS